MQTALSGFPHFILERIPQLCYTAFSAHTVPCFSYSRSRLEIDNINSFFKQSADLEYNFLLLFLNYLCYIPSITNNLKISQTYLLTKGQLNPIWIYEVIISPKIPTKNYRDFCPGSLLEGRAEICVIFGWDFGRNDDLINSFWI